MSLYCIHCFYHGFAGHAERPDQRYIEHTERARGDLEGTVSGSCRVELDRREFMAIASQEDDVWYCMKSIEERHLFGWVSCP